MTPHRKPHDTPAHCPLLPIVTTITTVSQNTISTELIMALAFKLRHLRKRAVCSARSWYAMKTMDFSPCCVTRVSSVYANAGGVYRGLTMLIPITLARVVGPLFVAMPAMVSRMTRWMRTSWTIWVRSL